MFGFHFRSSLSEAFCITRMDYMKIEVTFYFFHFLREVPIQYWNIENGKHTPQNMRNTRLGNKLNHTKLYKIKHTHNARKISTSKNSLCAP